MDQLPELQSYSNDQGKLSLPLQVGIGVAFFTALFGHAYLEHDHNPPTPMRVATRAQAGLKSDEAGKGLLARS